MMGLFLIILIGLYFYKTGDLQNFVNKVNTPGNSNEARNILDLRFAKGEISEEEYTKMKKIL